MDEKPRLENLLTREEYEDVLKIVKKSNSNNEEHMRKVLLCQACLLKAEREGNREELLAPVRETLKEMQKAGQLDGEWWYAYGLLEQLEGNPGEALEDMQLAVVLLVDPAKAQARLNILKKLKKESDASEEKALPSGTADPQAEETGLPLTILEHSPYFEGEGDGEGLLMEWLKRCYGRRPELVRIGEDRDQDLPACFARIPSRERTGPVHMITLGLGNREMDVSRAGDQRDPRPADRAELIFRFPWNADFRRESGEMLLAALDLVREILKAGGWIIPGEVLPFPQPAGPFTALLIIQWKEMNSRVFTPLGSTPVAFFEGVFLLPEEVEYCSMDTRTAYLPDRLNKVISTDPSRGSIAPAAQAFGASNRRGGAAGSMQGNLEELRRTLDRKHFARAIYAMEKIPERSRTYTHFLLWAEALYGVSKGTGTGERMQTILDQLKRRGCMDPEWEWLYALALKRQERWEEACFWLRLAQKRGSDRPLQSELVECVAMVNRTRRYSDAEYRELESRVRKRMANPYRINCWMRDSVGKSDYRVYPLKGKEEDHWQALCTCGVGSVLTPLPDGEDFERVELVLSLPEAPEMGTVYRETKWGCQVANIMSQTVRTAWGGYSLHPGTWNPFDEGNRIPGFAGYMITRLPEGTGESEVKLNDKTTVRFYRLMFLIPEEMIFLGRCPDMAKEMAEELRKVPFGLEGIRPPALPSRPQS